MGLTTASLIGATACAARWKSSISRIQLVNGFHLGKIWYTNLSNIFWVIDIEMAQKMRQALPGRPRAPGGFNRKAYCEGFRFGDGEQSWLNPLLITSS